MKAGRVRLSIDEYGLPELKISGGIESDQNIIAAEGFLKAYIDRY